MNTAAATLKAQNITLQYGAHKIIDDLNISFPKPEIVSIIGPNGSGKFHHLLFRQQRLSHEQQDEFGSGRVELSSGR